MPFTIQSLDLSDFGSYEKLSLNLYDRGLMLVEGINLDDGGSNGAGKTTIFAGLSWTLFDDSLSDRCADGVIRLNQPDKTPVTGNTGGIVRLHCQGSEVEVHRYRKHRNWGNKLLLFVDGQEKTGATNLHTQSLIHEMLQMDGNLFKTIVLFPQRATGFAAGTDSKQKEILEQILQVQRFTLARKRVSEKLSDLSKSVSAAEAALVLMNDRIRTAENDLENLEMRLDQEDANWIKRVTTLRIHLRKIQIMRPNIDPLLLARYDECKKVIEASDSAIKKLDDIGVLKSEVNQRVGALILTQDTKRRQLEKFQKNGIPETPPSRPELPLSYYQKLVSDLERSQVRGESEIAQVGHRIKKLETEVEQAQKVANCPHCTSLLTEETRKALFGDKSEDLQLLRQNETALRGVYAENEKMLVAAKREVESAATWEVLDDYAQVQIDIDAIAKERTLLDQQAAELEELATEARKTVYNAMDARREAEGVQQMLQAQREAQHAWEADHAETLRQLLETLESETPLLGMKSGVEQKITELRYRKSRQERYTAELRRQHSYFVFWNRGFGPTGVKSLLFDAVIPTLNDRTAVHLYQLSGENAKVEFSSQYETKAGELRDKLNVKVEYRWGYNDYGGTSGGEQHRVDIATMLALGDLGSSMAGGGVKLRLMDEPFDDLDNVGKEKVFRLLRDVVTPSVGTLLVMSHDDRLSSMFDKRITVVKERGISRLEET